jgi:hypothetical protein
MGKSGKLTFEERINETVFLYLFEGIEAKCHICGSGRKRNLRPRIYLIKNKFQAIFVCMRCELTGGISDDLGRPSYRYRNSGQMRDV